MTIFTWLWIGWLVAFAVIEAVALKNDLPEDTLSEHVRRWLSIHTQLGRTVFLIAFGGFTLWFAMHITVGNV